MSQVREGFRRVRMVRHEYKSDEWATVYGGRLLAGEVYDIPEEDSSGKPLADKWIKLGVCVGSAAEQTHGDELRAAAYDLASYPGSYSAAMTRDNAARPLRPDGPVQKGMSPEDIMHPEEFPEGGMRELSPDQAAAMDRGEGMSRPHSGEIHARQTMMSHPGFQGGGIDPTKPEVASRVAELKAELMHLEAMSPVFSPQQPAQGAPRPSGPAGAFSADELEQENDEGVPDSDRPAFNRNQLKALKDAGYDTPDKMDRAKDEELAEVEGVGDASIKRFRESRKSASESQKGSGGPIQD